MAKFLVTYVGGGISIIEAADVEAAKEVLASHPFIGRGGTLQVSEFIAP